MTKTYDNRLNRSPEQEAIAAKYRDKQAKEKEKLDKSVVEYELNGKTFVIKKWKNLDTLARLPEFTNIWYGQVLATATEEQSKDELAVNEDLTGSGIYALQFLEGLQNIDFVNYVKQHLDNVFLKGSDKPVDLDEDLDNPMEIWQLFIKVSSVNFLMQLSQTICSTTTLIHLQEQASTTE